MSRSIVALKLLDRAAVDDIDKNCNECESGSVKQSHLDDSLVIAVHSSECQCLGYCLLIA